MEDGYRHRRPAGEPHRVLHYDLARDLRGRRQGASCCEELLEVARVSAVPARPATGEQNQPRERPVENLTAECEQFLGGLLKSYSRRAASLAPPRGGDVPAGAPSRAARPPDHHLAALRARAGGASRRSSVPSPHRLSSHPRRADESWTLQAMTGSPAQPDPRPTRPSPSSGLLTQGYARGSGIPRLRLKEHPGSRMGLWTARGLHI